MQESYSQSESVNKHLLTYSMATECFLFLFHVLIHLNFGQLAKVNLIGSNATDNDLFVIPNITLSFSEAQSYCSAHYDSLSNIYDPLENEQILQLINFNHIRHAFIGYSRQNHNGWQWQSNYSSDPSLWLESPFFDNSFDAELDCIFIDRFGWHQTNCSNSFNFVCQTSDHRPEFIENGPFALTLKNMPFNFARSLCRAQGYDLAQITEESEYATAESLCSLNSKSTNCWIGFERGTLNENEWQWVAPTNGIDYDVDLWQIFPWQTSSASVACQATTNLTISYLQNGKDSVSNISEHFELNRAVQLSADNVKSQSKFLFTVSVEAWSLPGLKCSVYFEDGVFNTNSGDYVHWDIVDTQRSAHPQMEKIVAANTKIDTVQTAPSPLDENAEWIWNFVYLNKSKVDRSDSVTFAFSFSNVPNAQNKIGSDCAAISYYPPNKWKTNNCQQENYPICNKYDHNPKWAMSEDGKFALLMDRKLNQAQSEALCQNVFGYGLAVIFSHYEFKQIDGLMRANNKSAAWIGLFFDGNGYEWNAQNEIVFDDWTFDKFSFPNTPQNGNCIQQQSSSGWKDTNCNETSYAVCNAMEHSVNFTESELGSFFLLSQPQSFLDGEQLCSDYIGIRSKGAIIYHPIENERAIWLCSNATNGKGCFIGFSNGFWSNGALIEVPKWSKSPWLNSSIVNIYDFDLNDPQDASYCTAIMPDPDNPNVYGWDIVDCDDELNMLCDSGNDHSQCWMLQGCAQCTLRSDCAFCGDSCQLKEEICYADSRILTEFGCPDFDPIISFVTMQFVFLISMNELFGIFRHYIRRRYKIFVHCEYNNVRINSAK